jgi:hypothetical protein
MGPGVDRLAELDKKIKTILSTAQFNRYKQIQLQADGPRAFGRPEVAKQLNLSAAQQEKIRSLQGGGPGSMRLTPGERPDPSKMRENREQMLATILEILTDAQRATYKKMAGEPFDLGRLMPPPPPPPQGE